MDFSDFKPSGPDPELISSLNGIEDELGLPRGFAVAQIKRESNFDPVAVGPMTREGRARGLAQVVPRTQRVLEERFGRPLDPHDRADSLLMYKELMGENLQKFKTPADAARAYNRGWNPKFWGNSETTNYVNYIEKELSQTTDPEKIWEIINTPLPGRKAAEGEKSTGKPKVLGFDDFVLETPPQTRESLAAENKDQLLNDLRTRLIGKPTAEPWYERGAREVASVLDLVASVPAMAVGVGADIGMRARGLGGSSTRRDAARSGLEANAVVGEALGSPFQKLLAVAGLGGEGAEPTTTDQLLEKASSLLEKGGEWVEKATNGVLLKEDVQSIVNTLMTAGGGRGLEAGMKKLLPSGGVIEGSKLSPDAIKRYRAEQLQALDPVEAAAVADRFSGAAAKAAEARAKRSTEARPLVKDPVTGEYYEPIPSMELTVVDSGLKKAAEGRPEAMNLEERAAVQEHLALEGPEGEGPTTPTSIPPSRVRGPRGQRGAIDVEALFPRRTDGKGLSLDELSSASPALALGSILQRSDYTLKTLDRLPQNKAEFSKAYIEQEMKREDVTDTERGVLSAALDEVSGEKISAKDLMVGVKKATGDFELTAKETNTAADYGIESLGREIAPREEFGQNEAWIPDYVPPEEAAEMQADYARELEEIKARAVPVITTLYRSPKSFSFPSDKHFQDPQLFGWTRSFEEGGVRHVVEIQSDLAQTVKKSLREALKEGKAKLEERKAIAQEDLDALTNGKLNGLSIDNGSWLQALREDAAKLPPDLRRAINERLQRSNYFKLSNGEDALTAAIAKTEAYEQQKGDPTAGRLLRRQINRDFMSEQLRLQTIVAGVSAKLAEFSTFSRIAPILKNWPKRLVREELARVHAALAERSTARAKEIATARQVAESIHRLLVDGGYGRAGMTKDEVAHTLNKARVAIAKLEAEGRASSSPSPVVRFATADTVAKVEGWPRTNEMPFDEMYPDADTLPESDRLAYERRQFSDDGHQTIYNRYAGDITKFLKSLGGKPYTDSHGHTWIEVPMPKSGIPKQMFGRADPALLARLAVMGVAGWTAGALTEDDHALRNALLGAVGAGVLSKLRPINFIKAVKFALGPKGPRMTVAEPAQWRESYMRIWEVDTVNTVNKIIKLVPKEADRTKITHAIEAGPAAVAALSTKLRAGAQVVMDTNSHLLMEGIAGDVIHSAVDNYMTHIIDWKKTDPTSARNFFASWGSGMSPATPFAKARKFPTIKDLQAAGIIPLTTDAARIVGIYSNSLITAVANKKFMEALKQPWTPNTSNVGPARPKALIISSEHAPHFYEPLNHVLLSGMRVHPDIVGQLKLLYDTSPPAAWMQAATGVSDIAKRMSVSLSLFHGKSLVEAAVRATSHPLRTLGALPSLVMGTHAFLNEVRRGSASSLVQRSADAGMKFSLEGAEHAGTEDAGAGFYPALKWVQGQMDSVVPGSGIVPAGFAEIAKKVDLILWPRLHAGLKLMLFDEKSRQLVANSLKRGNALTQAEADKIAATFADDVEGGLNYRKIAMEAKTELARIAGEMAFSPSGRRALQLDFFAPDWNIAATRIVVNAFGKGSGVKGMWSPTTLADLNRQLIFRSALWYLIGYDALNVAFSGHHIWENEDKTKIDLDPRGERHLQIDKGMMEVPNFFRHPLQDGLNKLGFWPRFLSTQTLGVEYVSPKQDKRTGEILAGPPMKDSRPIHALKQFLPFATKDSPTEGPIEEALTRTGVVQITGSTPETRAEYRRQRNERMRELKKELHESR